MPKHSDGPPSGGYRYGKEAIYSGLPSKAVKPTGELTKADADRRQTLSKFADYRRRVKSIGKEIPLTARMKEHSANAQKLAEQKTRSVRDMDFVVVESGQDTRLLLYKVRGENGWFWYFIEYNAVTGLKRKSKRYWGRPRWAYENKCITWYGWRSAD